VTPAYLPTRLLGDIGIVGLALLLLVFLTWSQALRRAGLPEYRQFLIAGGLALCFANSLSLPGYALLVGSMVAYAARARSPGVEPMPAFPRPGPERRAGRMEGKA
jgi:hypothetical protein